MGDVTRTCNVFWAGLTRDHFATWVHFEWEAFYFFSESSDYSKEAGIEIAYKLESLQLEVKNLVQREPGVHDVGTWGPTGVCSLSPKGVTVGTGLQGVKFWVAGHWIEHKDCDFLRETIGGVYERAGFEVSYGDG